ncbi:GNAT family N-acetyltransferase [bacterium]|nr:GNAT family N-acetyltransferase [bacterium]
MSQSTILTNPTEAELVAAVHENLHALFRSMQALPGAEIIETEQSGRHHAFPTNAMFRGMWRTRLPVEETEAAIDEAIAWFGARQAPSFFWWTDPETEPLDLAERLLARGFDGNWVGDPGMVADLSTLNQNVQTPPGLLIQQVADTETMAVWRDVFAESYDMSVAEAQAWCDATAEFGFEAAPWTMYVAHVDEKPAATSLLFNGAGVAGIYAVGTLPQERGKGVGAAITLKPLLDARRLGYHFAVLFSSRIGYSVYQRLGFRAVAGKIGIYMMEYD